MKALISCGIPLLAFICLSAPAKAHTRSQSYSVWEERQAGEWLGTFTVDRRRVTLLYAMDSAPQSLETLLSRHLKQTVRLSADGRDCPRVAEPELATAAPHQLRFVLHFRCPPESKTAFQIGAFFPVALSHLHFVRVSGLSGIERDGLLTVDNHIFDFSRKAADEFGLRLMPYVSLGAGHVATGYDHLAFLAALLLLAVSFWNLVSIITGFTLGHSLTLQLAATGVIRPDMAAIEALIGFSIAFAALEAWLLRSSPKSMRRPAVWFVVSLCLAVAGASLLLQAHLPWPVFFGLALFSWGALSLGSGVRGGQGFVLAAAFGLAHGAGFAGELLQAVPDGAGWGLLLTVLSFNLGVELGQLALAGSAVVLWLLLRSRLRHPLLFPAAACLLWGLGIFWFVSRSLSV